MEQTVLDIYFIGILSFPINDQLVNHMVACTNKDSCKLSGKEIPNFVPSALHDKDKSKADLTGKGNLLSAK